MKKKETLKEFDEFLKSTLSTHQDIEIPKELDMVVQNAIYEGEILNDTVTHRWDFYFYRKMAFFCCIVFIFLLNISPTFAKTVQDVPVLGEVFEFFIFRDYHYEDDIKYIEAKIPKFINTGNSDLEKRVNQKIQYFMNQEIKESERNAKDYYEAFIETGGKKDEFQPIGITLDYDIYCMSKDIVSFSIYKYETTFASYYNKEFYNIDMESGKYLTLKDYLGNDYKKIIINAINKEIDSWDQDKKEQLWDDVDFSELINEKTSFYIDNNKNINIVFDKYEVAVGAAGEVIFTVLDTQNYLSGVK